MESRHGEPGKPRRGAITLVGPVESPELIGSTGTEIDEKEIVAARPLLTLKAQTCSGKYTKLHQEITKDTHEQQEDQQ